MIGDIEIMEEMMRDIKNMTYGSNGGMSKMVEAYMKRYKLTRKKSNYIAIKALHYYE